MPFRNICYQYGAGLTVSEMVTSDTGLWHTTKSSNRLRFNQRAGICSVQLAGNDPQKMAQAAKQNVALGAQIIDINMGCPAKKVCKRAAGSALLKDEKLVEAIISAVVDAVNVPVTLKIRTGWSQDQKNAVRIAHIAEQSGIAALVVHGRTRACRFKGDAEYDTIKNVVKAVAIPVIANGDIITARKAKQVLSYTGAVAVMVGRGAQGNPWIFQQINHLLQTGSDAPLAGFDEIIEVARQHVAAIHHFYGDFSGVRIARKHIGWYLGTFFEYQQQRAVINQINDPKLQLEALDRIMERTGFSQEYAA